MSRSMRGGRGPVGPPVGPPSDGRGGWLPWGLARVRGDSMRPSLAAGDWLLVQYAGRPVPGDVVVARFADGALVVKRATERRRTSSGDAGWWLLSDDPEAGVDSRHRGPVRDGDVVAVGRARLWPRPRVLRRR